MDKQSKVDSEDTLVFEMGAVSEETKGLPVSHFETPIAMPGENQTPL
jgi:hypothetical protein